MVKKIFVVLFLLLPVFVSCQIRKCCTDNFNGVSVVETIDKPLYANPIAGERVSIAFQALDSLFFAKVRFQSKQLIYQDFVDTMDTVYLRLQNNEVVALKPIGRYLSRSESRLFGAVKHLSAKYTISKDDMKKIEGSAITAIKYSFNAKSHSFELPVRRNRARLIGLNAGAVWRLGNN